jgi:hypothetical protein
VGCDGLNNDCSIPTPDVLDADGDGYSCAVDCDDSATAVNSAATEDCTDGIDNDCNSLIDSQDLACFDVVIDITSSVSNVNVATLAGSPSVAVDVLVNIASGVTVDSPNTSNPALTTHGLPAGSTVQIINEGTIHGRGGDGACEEEGAGEDGGDAIQANVPVTIDNSNGAIYGGGGGGGSGDDPTGGGGGAGNGQGCDCNDYCNGPHASGGNGGNGPNRHGAIPGGLAANYNGTPGTGGARGNPGSLGGGGSGGAAQPGSAPNKQGMGGAGGGWGGGGGSGTHMPRNPGPGGDAGYAVRVLTGGSIAWVAGYNLTQVKGLAQ